MLSPAWRGTTIWRSAARLVSLGSLTATDECIEARLFKPAEARVAPGWIQRNAALYEAALKIVGPGAVRHVGVAKTIVLAKGTYVITMVGQAPDDNHLNLVVN